MNLPEFLLNRIFEFGSTTQNRRVTLNSYKITLYLQYYLWGYLVPVKTIVSTRMEDHQCKHSIEKQMWWRHPSRLIRAQRIATKSKKTREFAIELSEGEESSLIMFRILLKSTKWCHISSISYVLLKSLNDWPIFCRVLHVCYHLVTITHLFKILTTNYNVAPHIYTVGDEG